MENTIPPTAQFVMMTAEQFKSMVNEAAKELSQRNNSWSAPTAEPCEDDDIEDYLSREEVAQMLDVNLSTLWRWAKAGYLPCVHFGRKVKYPLRLIKLFVERNKGKFQS